MPTLSAWKLGATADVSVDESVSVDADGFESLELEGPTSTAWSCSDCNAVVNDLHFQAITILECSACGARWDLTLAGVFDGPDAHGIEANAWNPVTAPARFTSYLGVYSGAQS